MLSCYLQDLEKRLQPRFILDVEKDELFINAGLQDRVIQVFIFLFIVNAGNPRDSYNLIRCVSWRFFAIFDHGYGIINAKIISYWFCFICKWAMIQLIWKWLYFNKTKVFSFVIFSLSYKYSNFSELNSASSLMSFSFYNKK